MSREPTKNFGGAEPADDREYALCKNIIAVWDDSNNPPDNRNRARKMGSGDQTPFGAVVEFDAESDSLFIADAINHGAIVGRRFPNPDNWWMHLGDPRGRGLQNSFDLRMIADDTNRDFKRTHLSTQVINQCPDQTYGFLRDILKVIKLGASIDHEEMAMTPAGYNFLLKEEGKPNMTRGCVALNISKRGGTVTDKILSAQFWHVLSLFPHTTQSTRALGCASTFQSLLMLRGDVEFHLGKKAAHLAIEDRKYLVCEGIPRTGWLWIDDTSMLIKPGREHFKENDVSNQTIHPRHTHKSLKVVIFEPTEWVPTPPVRGVPPQYPDIPTLSPPTRSTHAAYQVDNFESIGIDVGVNTSISIPEELCYKPCLNVQVNFITPTGGFTTIGGEPPFTNQDIDVRLDFIVTAIGGDAGPAALDGSLSETINLTSFPGSEADRRVIFKIPFDKIKDAAGGKVGVSFYRSGSDDQADILHVVDGGFSYNFGPGVST